MIRKNLGISIILCLLSSFSVSQVYNFKFFTIKDGLSQSQVTDICEDEIGNLWIATLYGGITVYDGINVKYYNTKNGFICFIGYARIYVVFFVA